VKSKCEFFGDGFGMNGEGFNESIKIKVLIQQPNKRGALALIST